MTNPNELHISAAGDKHAKGGCGCGHHAKKAEGMHSCGCEPSSCQCGHNHGAHDEDADKDFSDPDVTRADGTNPAVRTVDEGEGHNPNAGWNDGIRPTEGGDAAASGASDNDKDQIN
ncbi:hypothetical protein CGLAU_11310 [Corynebacterium glaucum]|uniref:Uncharacterized protein n=1 Tax=Corynebacterium glaucum TaxID=187491 RepID=A0A1Q2HZD8_9CORY|nr:hypothetical protein [Corynebacterium glaucum]AQQ16194.1 hypothetical protein CGLAU_11310 [Corynebacterium glaucum]